MVQRDSGPPAKGNGTFTAVIYDADLTDNAYLKKLNGFTKQNSATVQKYTQTSN